MTAEEAPRAASRTRPAQNGRADATESTSTPSLGPLIPTYPNGKRILYNGNRATMPALLEALRAVSPAEAAAKHAALRAVRDAFVFREGASRARPTAPQYILDEACHSARQMRRGGRATQRLVPPNLTSCTLLPFD